MIIAGLGITTRCNADCVHCPRDAVPRPRTDMPWDTFVTVVNELNEHVDAFDFAGMGEPLVHPLFLDFVHYVHTTLHKPVYVTTNGALFTPVMSQTLKILDVERVFVSFNAHEPGLFGYMTGGLDFDLVSSNLAAAVQSGLRVAANVVVSNVNIAYLDDIKAHLASLGVITAFTTEVHHRAGHLDSPVITAAMNTDVDTCICYDEIVCVNVHGDLLPCVNDVAYEHVIGNLLKEPAMILLKRKGKYSPYPCALCRTCDDSIRTRQ